MKRPIGVMLLAAGAGLITLYNLYKVLLYMGIIDFPIGNQTLSFANNAQWGAALWTLLIAGIWVWVALGFWNLRAYAVQFGLFISLFTLIWGFFALLFGSSVEAETIPWLLAGFIYLYLSYPGVQQAFIENEKSRLTPEQVAAMEQLQAANEAAAAKPPPGMGKPADATPPAAPPADPPASS